MFIVLLGNIFLTVYNHLLEFVFNALSDSDANLPLVIQHFLRDFLNLDLTSSYVLDNGHVVPLDYERFVIKSVFPFEVTLFIERVFVHWISFV